MANAIFPNSFLDPLWKLPWWETSLVNSSNKILADTGGVNEPQLEALMLT